MTKRVTVGAEVRLRELGIELPPAPTPLGAYVEAVQTGDLLFLIGMLPIAGGKPQFLGRLGAELDEKAGYEATRMATAGDSVNHSHVADGASELLKDIFSAEKMSTRLVLGAASIPLGLPVMLDLLFEVEST
jgi:hypothetical protein